jgi:hypothetical protein
MTHLRNFEDPLITENAKNATTATTMTSDTNNNKKQEVFATWKGRSGDVKRKSPRSSPFCKLTRYTRCSVSGHLGSPVSILIKLCQGLNCDRLLPVTSFRTPVITSIRPLVTCYSQFQWAWDGGWPGNLGRGSRPIEVPPYITVLTAETYLAYLYIWAWESDRV